MDDRRWLGDRKNNYKNNKVTLLCCEEFDTKILINKFDSLQLTVSAKLALAPLLVLGRAPPCAFLSEHAI